MASVGVRRCVADDVRARVLAVLAGIRAGGRPIKLHIYKKPGITQRDIEVYGELSPPRRSERELGTDTKTFLRSGGQDNGLVRPYWVFLRNVI